MFLLITLGASGVGTGAGGDAASAHTRQVGAQPGPLGNSSTTFLHSGPGTGPLHRPVREQVYKIG